MSDQLYSKCYATGLPACLQYGDDGDNMGKESKQPSDESSNQQEGNMQNECQSYVTLLEDDDSNDNSEQLPI